MAESLVVTALISKRAELAGLIEHRPTALDRLADDLGHLDATLKLCSPEIDLRTIRVNGYRLPNGSFRLVNCRPGSWPSPGGPGAS